MSRHIFKTIYQESPICITFGFDRPLQEFFLNIERLDSDGEVEESDDVPNEEAADDGTGPVYISLADREAESHNLDYFSEKLHELGIKIPEAMLAAIQDDRRNNVGNYVVAYAADGTPKVLHPKETVPTEKGPVYLGEMPTEFGTLLVYRMTYPNGSTRIELAKDREEFGTLSAQGGGLIGPDEFFVRNWGENEYFLSAALACGLFEDTGRNGFVRSMTVPIWRIRNAAIPAK